MIPAGVALTFLVAPFASEGQQPGKVARVGILFFGSSSSTPIARAELVREELRKLGYVEGQTNLRTRQDPRPHHPAVSTVPSR
jgi:hypothetical protein